MNSLIIVIFLSFALFCVSNSVSVLSIQHDLRKKCAGDFIGLKPHIDQEEYYYFCKKDFVVFGRCPNLQIFNDTLKKCVFNKFFKLPLYDLIPSCKISGRFPVKSNCSLYYFCDAQNGKFMSRTLQCPDFTSFSPDDQKCSSNYTCTPTKVLNYGRDTYASCENMFPACKKEGHFRSPYDCSFHYKCSSKIENVFYQTRFKCKDGYYFHIEKEICVPQNETICVLQTSSEVENDLESSIIDDNDNDNITDSKLDYSNSDDYYYSSYEYEDLATGLPITKIFEQSMKSYTDKLTEWFDKTKSTLDDKTFKISFTPSTILPPITEILEKTEHTEKSTTPAFLNNTTQRLELTERSSSVIGDTTQIVTIYINDHTEKPMEQTFGLPDASEKKFKPASFESMILPISINNSKIPEQSEKSSKLLELTEYSTSEVKVSSNPIKETVTTSKDEITDHIQGTERTQQTATIRLSKEDSITYRPPSFESINLFAKSDNTTESPDHTNPSTTSPCVNNVSNRLQMAEKSQYVIEEKTKSVTEVLYSEMSEITQSSTINTTSPTQEQVRTQKTIGLSNDDGRTSRQPSFRSIRFPLADDTFKIPEHIWLSTTPSEPTRKVYVIDETSKTFPEPTTEVSSIMEEISKTLKIDAEYTTEIPDLSELNHSNATNRLKEVLYPDLGETMMSSTIQTTQETDKIEKSIELSDEDDRTSRQQSSRSKEFPLPVTFIIPEHTTQSTKSLAHITEVSSVMEEIAKTSTIDGTDYIQRPKLPHQTVRLNNEHIITPTPPSFEYMGFSAKSVDTTEIPDHSKQLITSFYIQNATNRLQMTEKSQFIIGEITRYVTEVIYPDLGETMQSSTIQTFDPTPEAGKIQKSIELSDEDGRTSRQQSFRSMGFPLKVTFIIPEHTTESTKSLEHTTEVSSIMEEMWKTSIIDATVHFQTPDQSQPTIGLINEYNITYRAPSFNHMELSAKSVDTTEITDHSNATNRLQMTEQSNYIVEETTGAVSEELYPDLGETMLSSTIQTNVPTQEADKIQKSIELSNDDDRTSRQQSSRSKGFPLTVTFIIPEHTTQATKSLEHTTEVSSVMEEISRTSTNDATDYIQRPKQSQQTTGLNNEYNIEYMGFSAKSVDTTEIPNHSKQSTSLPCLNNATNRLQMTGQLQCLIGETTRAVTEVLYPDLGKVMQSSTIQTTYPSQEADKIKKSIDLSDKDDRTSGQQSFGSMEFPLTVTFKIQEHTKQFTKFPVQTESIIGFTLKKSSSDITENIEGPDRTQQTLSDEDNISFRPPSYGFIGLPISMDTSEIPKHIEESTESHERCETTEQTGKLIEFSDLNNSTQRLELTLQSLNKTSLTDDFSTSNESSIKIANIQSCTSMCPDSKEEHKETVIIDVWKLPINILLKFHAAKKKGKYCDGQASTFSSLYRQME